MLNFDDPFVVRSAKTVIVVIAASLVVISLLGTALAIDWFFAQNQGRHGEGSLFLAQMVGALPALSGKAVNELLNTLGIFGVALPFVLGKVCFMKNAETLRLSTFGKNIFVVLVIAFALSLIPYFAIEADVWGDGHRIEADGVAKMQEWTKAVLRYSVMYGAALLGVRVSQ